MIVHIYFCIILSMILFCTYGFVMKSSGSLMKSNLLKKARSLNVRIAASQMDIPSEVSNLSAIYDMILVERLSSPEKTSSGLFLPKVEGKDQKHTGIVLSIPKDYGLESENGNVLPVEKLCPYKVGDTVYIRDPWGIGPMNLEIGTRFFSFHKADHITGKVYSRS